MLPFDVLDGSEETRAILVETLHNKGEKRTGLKEFLSDLEETEQKHSGNWWIAVDEYEKPRGALTVRYINDMSYLRAIWTRVLKSEDQVSASKALLEAWMKDSSRNIKKFQADLPYYHPIIQSIEEAGFQKEKMLLASYDLDTDWKISELPEDYIMRPVEKGELPYIYDKLIKPDLDKASPIYVSKSGFDKFINQLPDEALESWVVVEDTTSGEPIGFAASILNAVANEKEGEIRKAVLFGPHSTESSVLIAIIKEMLSYWKSKGIDSIRIMRSNEFYPSVIKEFDLELVNSTIRFVYRA